MPDRECVEVGSVAREAAAGFAFDPHQSDFLTRGVVQIGGKFIRIGVAQLTLAAAKSHEIQSLIAVCRDWILMQAQQIAACNAVHSADRRLCRWLFQCAQRMEAELGMPELLWLSRRRCLFVNYNPRHPRCPQLVTLGVPRLPVPLSWEPRNSQNIER